MDDRFKNENFFKRNIKFILLVFYVIFFIGLSLFIIYMGLNVVKTKEISYVNNSNIDYVVYLKKNNYFSVPYLGKGEKYITSLIDKIHVKYNYTFNSEDVMNGKYTYKLISTLVLTEQGKDDILWQKDFDLSNAETLNFDNSMTFGIEKEVDINYDYYNDLVTSFKKDYGVFVDANLIVKLQIDTELDYYGNNFFVQSVPSINIPLIEKTIEIDIKTIDNDVKTETLKYTKNPKLNYALSIVGTFFLVIYLVVGVVIFFEIVKSIRNRDKYEVYLRKIFGDYDQIIVNSEKLPNLNKNDVLDVSSFEELVDVQNEMHKPIIFNENRRSKIATFVLVDENRAFRYVVKSREMNK